MVKAGMRVVGAVILLAATACARQVDGAAVLPYTETPGPQVILAVDVDSLMLDLSRIRGITGGGEDLSVIPSMDTTAPVDIDLLAEQVPVPCRFVFAETATFGPGVADFHKTTYQSPSLGGLISQGAAVYRDPAGARVAFDALTKVAGECAETSFGQRFVGDVTTDANTLRTRPSGECGRDYQIKSVVLAEVTSCGYPDSVPDIVMTNLLSKVPG